MNYCRERLRESSAFDKHSFRTIVSKKKQHRIVIACPKGEWDADTGRCAVSMKAQAVLHPLSEGKCLPDEFEYKTKGFPLAGFADTSLDKYQTYSLLLLGGLVLTSVIRLFMDAKEK